jgi:tetratricopeptide (TPR) repeat protein
MTRTSRASWVVVAALAVGCASGVTPIRTHFNKGVYHHSHGDYEDAISEYHLALEEAPGDLRARFNLATSQEALADRLERGGAEGEAGELRRRAVEHYRWILAEHPEHLRASVNLAAWEIRSGDRAGGTARLERAAAEHPRSPLPRTALAAHALRAGDGDPLAVRRAVSLLEEALEIDPARTATNMLLGRARQALAALEPASAAEHLEKARGAYQRVLEKDPHDLATLVALGRLELALGEPGRAELWLRRALYVDPSHLEAHLLMADALEARGELEGATLHLWRARELEDPRARHLGPDAYRERLLDLYDRLTAREKP